MPRKSVRSGAPALSDGSGSATDRRLVTLAAIAGAVLLAAASTAGFAGAIVAVGAAGFLLLLALAGRERVALLVMIGAFASAPMYKGLAPSPDIPITPTDLLFGLGAVLLAPTLLLRPMKVPLSYVLGAGVILVTGTLSTLFSPAPAVSVIQFVQWLTVLVGLVGILALWAPGWKVVDLLLWSYVGGQVLSFLYSPFDDAVGNRHLGLSHHPNAFGEAGVMAFAVLMYLWRRNDALWYRIAVLGAGAASAASTVSSGSRAATVVIAGLILMIPFVERSAIKGFLLAIGGALFIIALPLVVGAAGEGSAISRLAGSGDAIVADQQRKDAQDLGVELFLQHPIVGNGFSQTLYVHNMVLGVLSSIGIIGLIGYLLVLYTLARPLFGTHPNRRLGYVVWAFIAITPTVPGLEDRTLWVPMAPAILLAMGMAARGSDPDDPESSELEPAATTTALSTTSPPTSTETP